MALPRVSMAQPSPRAVSKKPRCPKSRLCIQEASSGHRLRPALACLRRPEPHPATAMKQEWARLL